MQLGLLADDTEWDRCSFDEFLLGANMMILCPYSQDQDEFLTCIIKGGVYSSVFCIECTPYRLCCFKHVLERCGRVQSIVAAASSVPDYIEALSAE